jgi:hypothetical protein
MKPLALTIVEGQVIFIALPAALPAAPADEAWVLIAPPAPALPPAA